MASPVRWTTARLEPTASPRQPAALPDDVLVEIFLRVASHADLARVSTACVSFRRLVADPSFLRRYRSLHPPLLLGFLGAEREGFQPAEAPHPNAPAARALCSAAGFSFEYLPSSGKHGWGWGPCDARDGRVLLERGRVDDSQMFAWPDLAVCDPLSRQYLLLPRIPEDLLASVKIMEGNASSVDASLVPSGDWEEISFRVLRTVQTRTNLVVFIFGSTPGCWSVGASTTWDVLSLNIPLPRQSVLERPQFAYGCCYWKVRNPKKLLKLDMNTMEFSTVDLPPDRARENIAIVEAGEGSLGIFSLSHDTLGTSVDYYIFMQNVNGRAKEWHMKNTTLLPDHFIYYFIGSAKGYVFLACLPEFNSPSRLEYVCFSLEIKTSNIERFSRMGSPAYCPYFGFPPSMSPRRIQGYEVMQG